MHHFSVFRLITFFLDPQSCALYALTLSETSITAFNEVYRIIVEATNKRQMDSSQLYAVARWAGCVSDDPVTGEICAIGFAQ